MPKSARRAKKREHENEEVAKSCRPIMTYFERNTSTDTPVTTTPVTTTTTPHVESDFEITPPVSPDHDRQPAHSVEKDSDVINKTIVVPSTSINSKTSKHLTGTEAVLALNFNWLLIKEEFNQTTKSAYPVLYCKLCKKHNTCSANGGFTWVTEGYRLLRKDKVKDHQNSQQHRESVRLENQLEINKTREDKFSEKLQSVAGQLIEILFYIIKNNIPLDQFPNLVDLCIKNGSEPLQATRKGCNATYTSPESVHELLESLSDSVDENLLSEMRESLTYSLMVDEVCDRSVTKNLGIVIKYMNKAGEPVMKFLHDKEMIRSTGMDIKQATLDVVEMKELQVERCTNLTSDGASSFTGKHNGAAILLKREGGMKHALIMHCHDHRLALACRDAFAAIPQLDSVSEGLDSLFKYYKYSSVSSATLRHLQDLYQQAPWRIQQAKHHRWLSYDKAVLVVLKRMQVIREDLENASSMQTADAFTAKHKTDATALVNWITQEKTVRMLCLLGDVLPHLADLSLVFQRRSVDIMYIQPKLRSTLAVLENRKREPGPWENKVFHGTTDDRAVLKKLNCDEQQFHDRIRVPFLNQLKQKLEDRFENVDVISQLGVLSIPIDVLDSLPSVYREEQVQDLARHFGLDELLVTEEWVGWLEFLKNLDFPDKNEYVSTLAVLGKLILQRDSDLSQDLVRTYPNLAFLYSVVNTMSLSSAEVERLFSHLKIVKTDRRSSLSNKCLNWILNVKLNVDEELSNDVKRRASEKWMRKKTRRFSRYLSVASV